MPKATQKGCHAKYTFPYRGAFHGATRTGSTAHIRFPRLPAAIRGTGMVAQECTPTSHPQRYRICSAFYPYYDRTTPLVFPHPLSAPAFRSISAVSRSFRTVSAASPQSFRTVSAASPQCHGLSAASPQSFRTISAASPQSFRFVSRYLRTVAAVLPRSLVVSV